MTLYPTALDSDASILRIDDNITELGGEAINQLRAAVFAIEAELGVGLSGTLGNLSDRLAVILNENGTIKASALEAIGLVTLPIVNSHVGTGAGIAESKLALDYGTSNLHTLILAFKETLENTVIFADLISTDFLRHLAGTTTLSNNSTKAHHVASHIDLNNVPSDDRAPIYVWDGLKDKNGTARTAEHVADALLQINNDLTSHQNSVDDAHLAAGISVDVDDFQEIPLEANTVQKVIDYLDDSEVLKIGEHRAVQHANGIPRTARSSSLIDGDGYGQNVVSATVVNTFRAHPPATAPVDSNTFGDDVIQFVPDNTNFIFDSQFKNVQPGDIIRINYGNGIETSFMVESKRFVPGSEWYVRINGANLSESIDGYALARVDRPSADSNTYGVLAIAAANSIPSNLYPNLIGSVIVGHPKGATALGLEFDGHKINSTHYKLFLQIYPTGNPADAVIDLPAIDVTGDAGVSPGSYTLDKIVQQTNNALRGVGYNYRFIAFEHEGNFGIMLADSINNVSFSIVNVTTGTYANNVIANDSDGFDGLGLGSNKAGIASPAYQSTFGDSTAALTPTYIVAPASKRYYTVNGQRRDKFKPTYLANDDGYWNATINAKVSTGSSIEVTYKIDLDLCSAELLPGKTLIVQPTIAFDNASYTTNDYGRFIIKNANFVGACGDEAAYTTITVINGVHATGSGTSFTSATGLAVRIYFGEDSVGFNDTNMITSAFAGVDYHRYHEIFVNDLGGTFSHERARMEVQTESATLLSTANWHISGVAPKLKGYRDNITTENRYLRFYILSYDSTSGIYDGYIGQRSTVNADVLKTGPITEGRKNVVTRFYDESYIDYIDLVFNEPSVDPGSNILGSASPRYVDIEMFSTLRTNDEVMLLGSCEVNWDALANQNIIQSVKSLRPFGSVDESEFTRSALDFIGSGDRAMHGNGVIRGYEFTSVNGTETGEILFTGGEAHVNGRIVVSNASSVIIPQISIGGVLPSSTVWQWAVCVNMNGFLEPILVTDTAMQFFADDVYYVPSVTFSELINNRKDLTPIALVGDAISTTVIDANDVTDIRKFVDRIDSAQPLVVSSDDFTGNFHSFEAMTAWIMNHKVTGSKLKVRVRGSIDVSSSVDLEDIAAAIEFEGDNALINVTAAKGFLIGSNITFNNINFSYNPTGIAYTADDYINRTNGCIFGDNIETRSNVTINNCTFSCTMAGTQRPPFIMFELSATDKLNNLIVTGNRFEDTTTIEQAAIAVVGQASSGTPPAISNSLIENNHANSNQGCYLVSLATTSGTGASTIKTFTAPGLRIAGVTIRGNTFGTIGYTSSGRANSTVDGYYIEPLLTIDSNRAMFIGLTDDKGRTWVTQILLPTTYLVYSFGTGHVKIINNHCAWINTCSKDETAVNIFSSLLISGNTLSAFSDEYYEARYGSYYSPAIAVNGLATEKGSVLIEGNTINKRLIGADVHSYEAGIWTYRSAHIRNNIFRAFDAGVSASYGVLLGTATGDNVAVEKNSFYRNGADLGNNGAYIATMSSSPTGTFGSICDNYFDSMYVDDLDTITTTIRAVNVATYPNYWRISRNKNHLKTATVRGHVGQITLQESGDAPTPILDQAAGTGAIALTSYVRLSQASTETVKFYYFDTGTTENLVVSWLIPVNTILPEGAIVKSVTVVALGTDVVVTQDNGTLTLSDISTSETTGAQNLSAAGVTLTVTAAASFIVTHGSSTLVRVDLNARGSSSFQQALNQLSITYSE